MSRNSLQRGNELTTVIPGFILVIPAFAGMTTSERGNELLEFCDTLFRAGLSDHKIYFLPPST
ncbi:hypothetical protein [Endozoicomonas sp. 8E]|uniref:hypothetical protein n=1 Tax=Endozoicomonas sp. 8E TaxID=3035692 RepID=UPI002938F732|nr:hypothetical protein [Endozoicomonas sp. 8E]WOG29980.1 hypothetical protein P6910_10075 [Endozoicomonas sp. 8E]